MCIHGMCLRYHLWVPEGNGLLEQMTKTELACQIWHWKRRSEGLVMAVTDGDIEGKCFTFNSL